MSIIIPDQRIHASWCADDHSDGGCTGTETLVGDVGTWVTEGPTGPEVVVDTAGPLALSPAQALDLGQTLIRLAGAR